MEKALKPFKEHWFTTFRPPEEKARVRSVGHYALVEPDVGSWKRADFPELFWCISGEGRFRAFDRREYPLRPRYLWYYPPGSYHEFRPAPGGNVWEYRWLALEGAEAHRLFDLLDFSAGARYAGTCPDELFLELELGIADPSRAARRRMLGIAFEILTRAAGASPEVDASSSSSSSSSDRIAAARNAMEENYGDPNLSVGRLAESFGFSRMALNAAFNARYGIPPGKFIASLRLARALELLRQGDSPISAVARQCGYGSAGYFARVVKKTAGLSPGTLKKQP